MRAAVRFDRRPADSQESANGGSIGFALRAMNPASPRFLLMAVTLGVPIQAAQYGPQFDLGVASITRPVRPDVAYDATNGMYLVTWEDTGLARGTRARRVTAFGALVGNGLTLRVGAGVHRPVVASCNLRDAFVVLWHEQDTLQAQSIDAATGARGPAVRVSGVSTFEYDLAGDATLDSDEVIAVYRDGSNVNAARIRVNVDGTLTPFGNRTVATDTAVTDLHVSKSGGSARRLLVAWTNPTRNTIHAKVIDPTLSSLTSSFPIRTGNQPRCRGVDGDGTVWTVVYDMVEPGGVLRDVEAMVIQFRAEDSPLPWCRRRVEFDSNDLEQLPAVADLGGSILVGFEDRDAGVKHVYATSIGPNACESCDGERNLESHSQETKHLAMASQLSGGGPEGHALVVWESSLPGSPSTTLQARRYLAPDGRVTDLGGGCGTRTGDSVAPCAKAGNQFFTIMLRDSGLTTPFLLLSPSRLDLPCGSCRLVPNVFEGVMLTPGDTWDPYFSVSLPLARDPRLAGLSVYAQWLGIGTGDGCSALGLALSNALRIEIQ